MGGKQKLSLQYASGQAAAVDHEAGSRNPVRHIASKEQNGLGHILGRADSSQRAISGVFHKVGWLVAKL